jgi:hypothetical protein
MPQDWEEVYRAAVLEMDHYKMAKRIDVAISVLTGRLLEAGFSPEHNIERRRIVDALHTLDVIRRAELQLSAILTDRLSNTALLTIAL